MNTFIRPGNLTVAHEFYLLGFTEFQNLQMILFLIFSLIYLMTLFGNLIILVLIYSDHHLHTPMYFFLCHLACLDAFSTTVTQPRMILDLFRENKIISRTACLTQIFFFLLFTSTESFILAGMSYDRYVAICKPLHYVSIMPGRLCAQMASTAWALGFLTSLSQVICAQRLIFCGKITIHSFFCDLPLLLRLACSDVFINILLIFIIAFALALPALGLTFVPYMHIFWAIQRISDKKRIPKSVSTCTSHLTVVFIFYGSFVFSFLCPKPNYPGTSDNLVPIIYTAITPLINPFIYSLRNKDLINAFRKLMKN